MLLAGPEAGCEIFVKIVAFSISPPSPTALITVYLLFEKYILHAASLCDINLYIYPAADVILSNKE